MKIPLHHFEEYIDETILKRGLQYFKSGYVNPPEELSPGQFEAIVRGTEDYTVHIHIDKGIIIDYDCNCPYDMGPVCKHIVGVIFYLQKEELGLEQKTKKNKSTKPPAKRKTVTEKLSDLLDNLSSEDLKIFISEQSLKDSSFRQTFMLKFAHLTEKESKEFYAKQVKAILRSSSDKYGFVSWAQARFINKSVNELLITANKHLGDNNFKSAILISCAVLEEMTKALQFVDDSNGDIGANINTAFGLLFEIASSKIPEDIRSYLIDYCFSAYEKEFFNDWDWHIGMLEIASVILKTKEDEEKIFRYIDNFKDSKYGEERIKDLKYTIILKTKGEKEADKFIEKNLNISSFRNRAIEKSIKAKDYEKATLLAKEGIKNDEESKPGLVRDWYEWLLKIAIIKKDKPKIIEYARLLFLDSFSSRDEHYKLLKDTVEPGKWNDFVEELINNFKKDKWYDFHRLAFIYIKEEMWGNLLQMLKEEASLDYLESYGKYLLKNYSKELADIYEKGIKEYLEQNADRGHYQTACKFIRRMKKLGVKEKVDALINELRNKYNRRPALLEELNKV
jgi:hypothetical protein